MMRFFFLICLFFSGGVAAQLSPKSFSIDTSVLRSKIKGQPVYSVKWTDKLGLNFLVLTETAEFKSSPYDQRPGYECEECRDKELYAYHFINDGTLLWRVTDYERACMFDVAVQFRKNSMRVTDLDKDGIAETWFMYIVVCKSDVSPNTLKLMMHEGSKKYAIRGTSQFSQEMLVAEGGKYQPDAKFRLLPKSFQDYAKKLWHTNLYDQATIAGNQGQSLTFRK